MTARRREQGGVTTIVALLLSIGAFLGFGAIAIDTGNVLVERRELQNSADAAALSLAASCATNPMNCVPGADGLYDLANRNSRDGVTGVLPVTNTPPGECATNVGGVPSTPLGLPACPPLPSTMSGLTECGPLPPALAGMAGLPFVEVRTESQRPGGGGPLPGVSNFLAGKVTGDSDTTVVNACARAAYGVPGSVSLALPLAISVCEFQRYTGASAGIPGAAVPPPVGAAPGYGGPGQPAFPDPYSGWPNKVLDELYVMTHSTGEAVCAYKGKDTAGGFGWLESDGCSAVLEVDSTGAHYWAEIEPGNSMPGDCVDAMPALQGTVIDVPVFDCLVRQNPVPTGGPASQASCEPGSAGGAQTWYHVAGFAKFYLSGNKLGKNAAERESVINGVLPCSSSSPVGSESNPWSGGSGRCISGWFVSGQLSSPSISTGGPSGGDFGTFTVVPAG